MNLNSPQPLAPVIIDNQAAAPYVRLPSAPQAQEAIPDDGNEEQSILLKRSIAALFRYKWLIVGITLLGGAGGYYMRNMFSPVYEAEGKIWISQTGPDAQSQREGPVRAAALLPSNSWGDLLLSYSVLGKTVHELHLFIRPVDSRFDPLFSSVDVAEKVRPGLYALRVDSTGTHYTLSSFAGRVEHPVERGIVGDSIGRTIGLQWMPSPAALANAHVVAFFLSTPRQAAQSLRGSVRSVLPQYQNIMRVYVDGSNAWRASSIANSLLRQLVETAGEFKRRNLTEVRQALDAQLSFAGKALQDADSALERFRMQTITLPSEAGTPINGGVAVARNPAITNYFNLKLTHETVGQQRVGLERTLADIQAGKLDVQALWQVLPTDAGSQDIGTVLTEYTKKQSELRNDLLAFTEDYQGVKEARAALAQLKDHVIPGMVRTLIDQLKRREDDLTQQIGEESSSLQAIPPRTIEEVRLTREVEARTELFAMLQRRYEEARLAELSVEPDLSILDAAGTPEWPVSNRRGQVFFMGLFGSFAGAAVLALMLDRLDKRIRYLQQVRPRLGLSIVGTVPHAPQRRKPNPLILAQLVESFRSIRLNVTYAAAQDRRLALTITSTGTGDGKSFVSANLALAFAEGGYRTLVIDGDLRRGSLHSTFHVDRRPGLVEVLRGEASLVQGILPTSHAKLSIMPSGARLKTAPELLTSDSFRQLIDTLQARFDVILIDSPPLAAGMDPYALCAATENALMVVRMAQTHTDQARQKLEVLQRFPVRVLGTVVNDVRASVGLNYEYTYLAGYAVGDEEDEGLVAVGEHAAS